MNLESDVLREGWDGNEIDAIFVDSCIELAVARHMCGMLNQNVHRTFWLKHSPGVSPGQILKNGLRLCIFFRTFFEHVGFVGRRVGAYLQCSDQGSG